MSVTQLKQQIRQRWLPVVSWYHGREPREKRVLQILAVVVLCSLLYWLLWSPAVSARDSARQRYIDNMQTRNWIEANAAAVRQANAATGNKRLSSNWVSDVSRSANDFGLTLKGFSPDGNRAVRIQLEEQPVAQTILWLQSLQQKHVQLATIEMSPGNQPGTATVRATLQQ